MVVYEQARINLTNLTEDSVSSQVLSSLIPLNSNRSSYSRCSPALTLFCKTHHRLIVIDPPPESPGLVVHCLTEDLLSEGSRRATCTDIPYGVVESI